MLELQEKIERVAVEIQARLAKYDVPELLTPEGAAAVARALLDPANATSGAISEVVPRHFNLLTSPTHAHVEIEHPEYGFITLALHTVDLTNIRPEYQSAYWGHAFAEGTKRVFVHVDFD